LAGTSAPPISSAGFQSVQILARLIRYATLWRQHKQQATLIQFWEFFLRDRRTGTDEEQVTVKSRSGPPWRLLGRRMERKSPGLKVHRHHIPLPPLRTAVTRMCMPGSKTGATIAKETYYRGQRDLPMIGQLWITAEERYAGRSPEARVIACVIPL
jgi:hypothetical protein